MCENTSAAVQIISSTSYRCPGGPEKSSSSWCKMFAASNVLYDANLENKNGAKKWANFWLAEQKKAGEEQGFIMSLGCNKRVRGVELRNTHAATPRDRSTKKFRILGSVARDGPWQELLVAKLEDARHQHPPPLQQLMFSNSAVVSFVKFELFEFYGLGGGLQYFALVEGG